MPRFVPPLAASVQNPPVVTDRGRVIVLRTLPKAWKKRLHDDLSDEFADEFYSSSALCFGASPDAVLRAAALRGDALLENIDKDALLYFGLLVVACDSAATADDVEHLWRRLLTSNELIPKGRVGLAVETSHRITVADDVDRVVAAIEKAERENVIKFEDAFEPLYRHVPKPRPRGRANKKRKLGAD